jgi:hypothetical protein
MPPRRLPQPARTAQPRLAETASDAADKILRRKPALHRIASYAEVREYHTHRRWWVRRGLLAVTIFALAYPVNHSVYVTLTKHAALSVTPRTAQVMNTAAAPLAILRRECGAIDWCLGLLDDGCDAIVQLSLGKVSLAEIVPVWMLFALPVLVLSAYAISPGPVWWGFRLCAIELMARVYALMELLYAPLVWLVDRSQTARNFYEGYYDAMEWTD